MAAEKRTTYMPSRYRADGDCRTPLLPNKQNTLWGDARQCGGTRA
jgi:hypothetical protein